MIMGAPMIHISELVQEFHRDGNAIIVKLKEPGTNGLCSMLEREIGTHLNCNVDGDTMTIYLRSSSGVRLRIESLDKEELAELLEQILTGRFTSIRDKVLYIRFMALRPHTLENILRNALRIAEAWRRGEKKKMPPSIFTFFERTANRIARLERILASMKTRSHPLMKHYYEWGSRIIDTAYRLALIIEDYESGRHVKNSVG